MIRPLVVLALCLAVGCAPRLPERFDSAENDAVLALALEGDADAQVALGQMLEQGRGGAPDYDGALHWYRRAASQGNALAAFSLGQLYEQGRGVARDYAEAVRWYTRAAKRGSGSAAFRLGVLYEHGLGVARDTTRAAAWYQRAATQWSAGVAVPLAPDYVIVEPARTADAAAAARTARVHLASVRDTDQALAVWQTARESFADVLGGLALVVVELELGAEAGLFYQVQAGPFADDAAAETACAMLNERGQFCRPVPAP